MKDVSFGRLDRPNPRQPIDAELRLALDTPEFNIGLLALLDLSHDLVRNTDLKARIDRRHLVTHRFVVAHNIIAPESHEWVDRVDWLDLVEECIAQLQTARAALIYLARLISRHEAVTHGKSTDLSAKVDMGAVDSAMSELL